ncbi:MAG TPA: hypothetical protein VGM03_06525 [Phycisphaerae bacterium]|jgi:hypothetical protein
MMHPRSVRSGYLLVEALLVVGVGAALIFGLGKLALDGLTIQRLTSEHANRLATLDNLSTQLRRDALSAVGYRRQAQGLDLQSADQVIQYTVAPAVVTRTAGGAVTHVWQYGRLSFSLNIESGPDGDVVLVDGHERPHRKAIALSERTFSLSTLLPPKQADEPAATGGDNERQ